jgi:tRNA(Ile)-lysidine synthase
MNTLYQKIFKFIKSNELIVPGDKLLLALSGGADSVFVFHFLHDNADYINISFGAVYIHHHLRGREADEDREFCRNLCEKYNIPFFTDDLDVVGFAKENRLSIEEAARELRYKKLSEICYENGFDKIVAAHNQSDNTETILLNLVKGTGLDGLTGIPVKRENIIRPILSISREEIENYLSEHNIEYRIDSTNESSEYQRNFLRNEILPSIKRKLNPSLDNSIFNTTQILTNLKKVIDNQTAEAISKYVKIEKDFFEIDLTIFKEYDEAIFGEILKTKVSGLFQEEFNYNDFEIVSGLKNKQVGKYVEISENVIAVRERDTILIKKREEDEFNPVTIKIEESFNSEKFELRIDYADSDEVNYSNFDSTEFIDANKIKDNFILRRWTIGDKFYPLGMRSAKKVSDFLNEQKVPANKKKKQLVLVNRNNIVWVVGLRIDNRFKVTDQTNSILKLSLRGSVI